MRRIPRHLLTGALAVAVFYGLMGVEVQCTQAEARPSLADLQAQIDELAEDIDALAVLRVFDRDGTDLGLFVDHVLGETAPSPFRPQN